MQVVHYRMAFFSDAVGHSAFAGVAVGLILGVDPHISMPLFGLAVGLVIMFMQRFSALPSDTVIGVVFSAVSDPVSTGVVESLEAPGANLTGTSDYLDTNAIMDLIFAADPDADTIGLLYDVGQDSSATPIAHAKEYLEAMGESEG